MNKKKIGVFYIPAEEINSPNSQVDKIFILLGFVPIRTEFMAHKGSFEYIGYSDLFRETDPVERTPSYNLKVNTTTIEIPKTNVKFQEISSIDVEEIK